MHCSARLLRAVAAGHTIDNLRRHVFKSLEYQFGKAPKGRLGREGLAISGGVDSMALASLCSQFKEKNQHCAFSGFIVDHGVRSESTVEAKRVARELQRLDIEPYILTIDWSKHGNPRHLANFETIARQLRYQSLGRGCYQQGISDLLVAHHAEDLAETIVCRIHAQYLGEGLQGIKSKTPIPECQGIYGVDASGDPFIVARSDGMRRMKGRSDQLAQNHISVEKGGVFLTRPLLPFTKDKLIELCQQNGILWFEDRTNRDKTLTLRNTVRHLQQTRTLPAALRRERLSAVAASVRDKHRLFEQRAKEIFYSMSIALDLSTGQVTFQLPQNFEFGMTANGEPYHVKALLARRLLTLVSPMQAISLQSLDPAMEILFEKPFVENDTAHLQGVVIHKRPLGGARSCRGKTEFTISRQKPHRASTSKAIPLSTLNGTASDHPAWTDFLLWDNRYWIRVGRRRPGSLDSSIPSHHLRFSVEFLTPDRIRGLRALDRAGLRRALDAHIRQAGDSRWSQPVLIMKIDDGISSTIEVNSTEMIVGLPALGWMHPPARAKEFGLIWEIRYKNVEFGLGEGHSVAGMQEIARGRTSEKAVEEQGEKWRGATMITANGPG